MLNTAEPIAHIDVDLVWIFELVWRHYSKTDMVQDFNFLFFSSKMDKIISNAWEICKDIYIHGYGRVDKWVEEILTSLKIY